MTRQKKASDDTEHSGWSATDEEESTRVRARVKRGKKRTTHGWIDSGTVRTRLGSYAFQGGYPTQESARKLAEQLVYNRAVELYLSQLPVVSQFHVLKGAAEAATGAPNQVVVWETLMDAKTVLLTGNTETVYGMSALDLRRDGPTVIELPPKMLGTVATLWQSEILGVGPTGADQGKGGKFLILPPDHEGTPPDGYFVGRSTTYRALVGLRGFQVDGKPDQAAALMKQLKVYPLAKAAAPPPTTLVNGSGQRIDTIFPDTDQYFVDLATIFATEPASNFSTLERFQLAAIGIEPGKVFAPDEERAKLLADAARFASAVARANSFDNVDPERLVYPDRRWEWAFIGGSATWDSQGYLNSDRRAAFAYIAIGMAPAMVDKVVGQGSQYLVTTRDATGAHLDGGKTYRLRLPANIPAKNFWSVVAYDARSRSLLDNGQEFPSVSSYTHPTANADGSIDVTFGPDEPEDNDNWIRTFPGVGWFPLLRFYGPLQPFFDQTWKPDDIVALTGD
ncbi:MAG TPA: DUF1254 domain-containing protein [Polyangiaceae bacterium]|nr:DUF1254 domain-containing protein [Polyangiaceae bacterium]